MPAPRSKSGRVLLVPCGVPDLASNSPWRTPEASNVPTSMIPTLPRATTSNPGGSLRITRGHPTAHASSWKQADHHARPRTPPPLRALQPFGHQQPRSLTSSGPCRPSPIRIIDLPAPALVKSQEGATAWPAAAVKVCALRQGPQGSADTIANTTGPLENREGGSGLALSRLRPHPRPLPLRPWCHFSFLRPHSPPRMQVSRYPSHLPRVCLPAHWQNATNCF